MAKNLSNLSNEKTHYSFFLNYRGIGKKVCEKGNERGLKKWNPGKII